MYLPDELITTLTPLFVFVLHPLLFPTRGVGRRLQAPNVYMTNLILEIGCSSYHLAS